MTLRLRLMLIIGLASTLLWTAASVWMLLDLRHEFRDTLDERLAASARMVSALVTQLPPAATGTDGTPTRAVLDLVARDGVACEVSLLRGEIVVRTRNTPASFGTDQTGYGTRNFGGVRWRSYTLREGDMRITTADRLDRRESLLHDIVIATSVPFLIAAIGSLIAFWFGIRRGLAPLETMRGALANRGADQLEPLPQTRLPAELVPLSTTINRLLQRVRSAIERERSFTGNAAHELRTPLTAIKTHLQIARMTQGRDTEMALADAEEGVQRLQRTLDQLLTLARVEGPFTFDGEQELEAKLVADLAMRDLPPESRERVRLDGAALARKIRMPAPLATTALRNLLDNALRYSPPGSPVGVSVNESGEFVSFRVADSGPGMREHERAHAVQRFWRQGRGQGSGLGLSIVDAIVRRYRGALQLSTAEQGGTVAEILLPSG